MSSNKIINFASYNLRIRAKEPKIKMLQSYWRGLTGTRKMPRRDDFNPLDVRPVISDIFTILYETDTGYYVSFAGQNVMRFLGIAFTNRHEDARFPYYATEELDSALNQVFTKGRPARCLLTAQGTKSQAGCLGLFPFSQQGSHPIQALCVLDLYTPVSHDGAKAAPNLPSNVVDLSKRLERQSFPHL